MLLKVAGFVALVASSSVAGNLVAASYRARVRQLGQLRVGLHLLESEVAYATEALPTALGRVAAGVASPVRRLFAAASDLLRSGQGLAAGDAWREAACRVFPETALEAADLEVILALSGYLGVTDRDDQVRHLRLASERLAAREQEAAAEQRASERMWRYLGVLGGLALGIAFL